MMNKAKKEIIKSIDKQSGNSLLPLVVNKRNMNENLNVLQEKFFTIFTK